MSSASLTEKVTEWLYAASARYQLGARYRVLRRRVWRRWDEIIFVVELSRETRVPQKRPNHDFEVVSLDTLAGDADFPTLELVGAHEIRRRLHRGDLCFIARVDGEIAAYAWTGDDVWNLDDVGIDLRLGDDEAYMYDLYISPRYRGQRLFYAFMSYIWSVHRDRGVRAGFMRIRRRNIAAIAGTRFFGTNERVELQSVRVLSLLRFYIAEAAGGSGRAIEHFKSPRTQFGPGLLVWSAEGRSGFRVNASMWRRRRRARAFNASTV